MDRAGQLLVGIKFNGAADDWLSRPNRRHKKAGKLHESRRDIDIAQEQRSAPGAAGNDNAGGNGSGYEQQQQMAQERQFRLQSALQYTGPNWAEQATDSILIYFLTPMTNAQMARTKARIPPVGDDGVSTHKPSATPAC